MKKIIILSVLFMLGSVLSQAQELRDSVVYRRAAAIDSTLYGRNILEMMPSRSKGDKADVHVRQSEAVMAALSRQIAENPSRTISGYRVRIYFDNSQNARTVSEKIEAQFARSHPEIPVYRSFQSPYFKVTVGDFRNKSEAMEVLERLKAEYPSAFILKENIGYPAIDKEHSFEADTIKVTRKTSR